jgi:hypothetical protein
VTLKARNEHGDWITRDAAIGIWTSDLQRALHAFTRPSQYGAAVLAIFGLGTGKRSVHFDWIGTSLAALSSNLPEIHSASSFHGVREGHVQAGGVVGGVHLLQGVGDGVTVAGVELEAAGKSNV